MVPEKKNRLIAGFAIVLFAVAASSCMKSTKQFEEMKPYDGPMMVVDDVETLYSDSAVVRVKLKAAKQIELQNGDREFPNGVFVEFFDEAGRASSTLKANTGKYQKESNIYIVNGNVEIHNTVKKEKLNSEELNWDPRTHKIYTEKSTFVRIETPDEILTGKGLTATEDFSQYKILDPVGTFTLPENKQE